MLQTFPGKTEGNAEYVVLVDDEEVERPRAGIMRLPAQRLFLTATNDSRVRVNTHHNSLTSKSYFLNSASAGRTLKT